MDFKEIQLTHDPAGHTINSTQCFSPDDQWIVYDTRNDDTQIISTGEIAMVNTGNGEIRTLYKTQNQTAFGPGVGAATFSPVSERVLFIHGIRNATAENPYSMTRRTGVAVDLDQPLRPVFMDARDIRAPFTLGALRGGTHAHSWSGDGAWISFTYNDYLLELAEKSGTGPKDLRTIAVMVPGQKVVVENDTSLENNSGEMYAFPVARVTDEPSRGSDEIEKAFDESWIGAKGYQRADGSWQHRAIAFQGNVRTKDGKLRSEVFVVDIPDSILDVEKTLPPRDRHSEATVERLPVSTVIRQRRITHLEKGILGPRHWIRTTSDGLTIGFLSEDAEGNIQIFGVSPLGGEVKQLTFQPFSVQGPFNFSPDGKSIAYIADNSIFVTQIENKEFYRVTPKSPDESKPISGVVWSKDGNTMCFNRFVNSESGRFVQIFLLKRE